MANLNRAFLIGNLTRDPELRYTPNGTAVTTFTVAMNRVYTLQSGERREEASFVRVVVWGKAAERCGEFLRKGSAVFVEGRLQSRSWEGQDGQKRSTLEVVANSVQFLDRRQAQVPAAAAAPREISIDESNTPSGPDKSKDENIPF